MHICPVEIMAVLSFLTMLPVLVLRFRLSASNRWRQLMARAYAHATSLKEDS